MLDRKILKQVFIITTILLSIACKKPAVTQTTNPVNPIGGGNTNFSSAAVVPVQSSTVRLCFSGMAMKNVHPRLLYTKSEIQAIKILAATDGFAKEEYDDIIAKANAILTTALLDYGLDGAGLRISNIHKISNDQIPYLVLAYQFTGDTKYALRCWQQLERMCNYPDWGANRHFLDAGIAAKGIAIAYDGLFDYLTTAQQTQLYNAVKTFVLQPGKTQIETNTGVWKWYLSNDNWNGICHGGMIMAALAGFEQDTTFNSSVIAMAANGIKPYMESLEPDGASEEGLSYWSYGLSNTFLAFESMKRCLSSTYGLAEQNGFKKTGWFPYLVSGPVGTVTLGDDYVYAGKANRFLSYFWFSNYLKDANLAKAHYDACLSINAAKSVKMNGWTDLLFYKKELVQSGAAVAVPLQGYIKGLEYMYVREMADDENSMYIGIHGGDNNASHGHLDAGTFFIQAFGENFAMGNLGKEEPYPADYFTTTAPAYSGVATTTANTPGRFYYYRVRTESKNCLVFNPDARPEQNLTGVATIANQGGDNVGGFYVVDVKDCYKRDVSNYQRGIKLNRTKGIITIQDEFTPLSTNSTVYWLMQSPATDGMVISADGKTATLTKNGKIFFAIIKTPDNAQFEKVDRSTSKVNYLTETANIFSSIMNGKNSLNPYYGKLQIKLTSIGLPTTIRVDFVKSIATETPVLKELKSWSTVN
jgi:hypothetical protein